MKNPFESDGLDLEPGDRIIVQEPLGLEELTVEEKVESGGEPAVKTGKRKFTKSQLDTFLQATREPKSKSSERDPMQIHESRTDYAQKQDEARDARLTTDVEKWASDPNSWDFPGVDTGPQFREEQSEDFDTDSFLDRIL